MGNQKHLIRFANSRTSPGNLVSSNSLHVIRGAGAMDGLVDWKVSNGYSFGRCRGLQRRSPWTSETSSQPTSCIYNGNTWSAHWSPVTTDQSVGNYIP